MPETEAKKKWQKENTEFIGVKLQKSTDADIIEFLQGKVKNAVIKAALREYIAVHAYDDKPPITRPGPAYDCDELKTGIVSFKIPVVMCKDCKHNYDKAWNQGKQDDPRCDFTDRKLKLDDFCSRGERE